MAAIQNMEAINAEKRPDNINGSSSALNRNESFAEKIATIQAELEKDIRKLKIKVLTGDGNLNSAKEMAKRLRGLGYNIKLIDRAPRSNFTTSTVYYAPDAKNEAERLMSSLDGNLILKPISWSSIFDIIVVACASD